MNIGRQQLACGDPSNALYQLLVMRRAEADVVREDRGSTHVAVAVNRIRAVQQRNPKPALERLALHAVHHACPGFRIVRCGIASAAAEHRPDPEVADRAVTKAVDVDLGDLADLLQ